MQRIYCVLLVIVISNCCKFVIYIQSHSWIFFRLAVPNESAVSGKILPESLVIKQLGCEPLENNILISKTQNWFLRLRNKSCQSQSLPPSFSLAPSNHTMILWFSLSLFDRVASLVDDRYIVDIVYLDFSKVGTFPVSRVITVCNSLRFSTKLLYQVMLREIQSTGPARAILSIHRTTAV